MLWREGEIKYTETRKTSSEYEFGIKNMFVWNTFYRIIFIFTSLYKSI